MWLIVSLFFPQVVLFLTNSILLKERGLDAKCQGVQDGLGTSETRSVIVTLS